MTKKELDQLLDLRDEQKMWEFDLYKLKNRSLDKGQEITGMPFGSGTTDKTSDIATAIADKERLIEELKARCKQLENQILEFIATVDDSLIRQIINYRYMRGFSWCRTAKFMGHKNSPEALRKMLDRYLRKHI